MTRAPGYVLEVPAEVTDVFRLERLVAEGRRQLARRRPSECVRLLTEAESLWRGPAYSEVRDEPFARAEARRLEELLLSATETRIDAGLTLGRHEALVGELEALTSANPLRERLWSQRMLALYRSGRQAEALRVFQDLRALLVAELGIEPGHDVTWMEHAILAQEPALDFPVPPEPGAGVSDDATVSTSPPAYQVRVPASPHEGPLVGRARETRNAARLVDVGARRCRPPAAGGRRSRHRQDAPGGRARARRGSGRGAGAVGPLRRGSGGAVPALRGGARAILPVPFGGPDLAHARLAAHRALPARAAPS